MSDGSSIEWTDATWSPNTGCTKISDGCMSCYIERTPPFRMAHRKFDKPGIGGTTGVLLHPERLVIPLRWRKPRRIFVDSLADLFHADVPDDYIAQVLAVTTLAQQHVFQILTKRPARMRALLTSEVFRRKVLIAAHGLKWDAPPRVEPHVMWPLRNVWFGTSVEDQRQADIRVPQLMQTPAAVRFLSCEPLLSAIDLRESMLTLGDQRGHGLTASFVHAGGCCERLHGLSWVIAGAESGPGARPMGLDWVRSLRDQCVAADVPFFFKQAAVRGKKIPTPELDGRVWVQMPKVREAVAAS